MEYLIKGIGHLPILAYFCSLINKIYTMNKNNQQLADFRQNYDLYSLSETLVQSSPFEQFQQWFNETIEANFYEPNAMILATANSQAVPSVRTVLLKDFGVEQGFVFFTNYQSRKGHEIAQNPNGSLLFYWDRLHRQVRIEGTLQKVASEVSDSYFSSRPLGSQIGAIVSPQSEIIESRELLETRMAYLNDQYEQQEQQPQRPEHWGGYSLHPHYFEFWQGRTNRLHDRIVYRQEAATGTWHIERLAP